VAAVAGVVEDKVLDDDLVRVKLWRADGTIVYSDATDLIGRTYELGLDEQAAISSGQVAAQVSDLEEPENRLERPFGKLLEVYLPVRTPSGERLLFEAYFRYDAVSEAGSGIWRSFAPVTIGALAVLELIQIPLAWGLARRLRDRQREREALLRHAIQASDLERRRIAGDLHDGVVQELVGVAFELAGAAREPGVPAPAAQALAGASESVRATITSLRSMLLDIYPPDLAEIGLVAALEDLAADASDATRTMTVEPDTDLPASALSADTRRVLYRAAREGVRNVVRHSDARHATIGAGRRAGIAWVRVTDDGVGFDPALAEQREGEGHVGLRGLRGLVADVGGTLRIDSEDGAGTTLLVEIPVR
jgi:two-component system NarL family sensor kinase